MTSLPRLRTLVPAAALLAASFAVFAVVPRLVVPAVLAHAFPFDVADAQTLVCELSSGRSQVDCDEETEGKALLLEAQRSRELAVLEAPRDPGRREVAR